MPNPYVNKVVQSNGTTLIDISDTTAVASDVASGKYFYLASGQKVEGTGSGGDSGYTRTVIAEEQTVTPASTSLNGSTYYGATLNVSEGFEAGAEYIITLNGTEYFFTCQVLWGTNYLLGDINYFYGASNLPYPFGIIWTSGTTCTLARDNGNQVIVKIEKLELTGSGGGGDATLITKTITANGTYLASDDDADGYSEVTVNVPSSAASSWTKVAETTYTVSTTSTSTSEVATWATGHSELWTNSKWVYVRIRDTAGKRTGHFYGTDQFFMVHSTTAKSTTVSGRFCIRTATTGNYGVSSASATTGYGVYVDTIYSDGSIRIRSRYNSSYSLTIDGTYKVEVYLIDPPTGAPIFT